MGHMKKNKIELTSDLVSFFDDEVRSTAQKQGQEFSVFTSRYLAEVLNRFTNAERLFVPKIEGEKQRSELPLLANKFLEAQCHPILEQLHSLKELGDTALFMVGYFGDKVDKSLVDRDYYMAMGEHAYAKAGQIRETLQAEKLLNVFFEISSKFEGCAEVFAELSDKASLISDQNLIRRYEKWLIKKTSRLERMLKERGVIPSLGNTGDNSEDS